MDAPLEFPDELAITEREFADYAVAILETLITLAVAQDRALLARLLAIAAFEAGRLKQDHGAVN